MKYTITQTSKDDEEVIVKYHELTPVINQIIRILTDSNKIIGKVAGVKHIIQLTDILYVESVDSKTFAYTENDVLQLEYTLSSLEQILDDINFFRCSKSVIINIDKIKFLKNLASNRIDATMCNDEHVLISRTYASQFRKRLKEGK